MQYSYGSNCSLGHKSRNFSPVHAIAKIFLKISLLRDIPPDYPSGQFVPVLGDPHRKEVPHIQVELPVDQFLPLPSCPIAGHHGAQPGPSSDPPLKNS